MTTEEIYQVINKGIPNYVMVDLNTDTLIRECSSDTVSLINSINAIKRQYEHDVIDIMGYSKYRYTFFRDFRILTSYKNAETSLHVSPNLFLMRLKEILGVSNPSLDYNDLDLKNQLLQRLDVLNGIDTPEMLEKEFPLIYEDFTRSFDIRQKLERLKNSPSARKFMDYQWKMYDSYGMSMDFRIFMKRQREMYRKFITKRQFVEGTCHRKQVDLSLLQGLDKEKFNFYVAYKYMEKAKSVEELSDKQECVYYLMAYFRGERNSKLSIIGDNGEKVTYRKLLNDFKKLLSTYRSLKPIDEDRSKFKGYHVKHVINHINKYYGNSVNWIIVPDSFDPASFFGSMELSPERNVLSLEEKDERARKRMELYNQKIQFYENSGYVLKIFGWNEFNGYVCYVYPNGKIIMDKLFEDYIRCIPAHDEAIYAIDASEFETLSKYSKKELQESGKAKRFYHAGAWQSRVENVTSTMALPDNLEAVKKLELRRKS